MKTTIGPDLVEVMALAYKAGQPVLLEGSHGVGKSEILKQAASRLGVEFIVRDLSLMEPPDLVGIPRVENGRTVYAPPSFLPKRGRGLLVLEELNRAERYMMAPCLQLLTERTLNDYALPEGWLPVAAINPLEGGYTVNTLDEALLSRFIRVECEADVKAWLDWATDNGVHPAVCGFVAGTKDIFETTNPRSWHKVSKLVHAHESEGAGGIQKTLLTAVAGLVGDVLARAFIQAYRSGDAGSGDVTPEAVLDRFRSVKPTLERWRKERATGRLSSIAGQVMIRLQNGDVCDKVRRNSRKKKGLLDFIALLPADIGKRVKSAAKSGGALP